VGRRRAGDEKPAHQQPACRTHHRRCRSVEEIRRHQHRAAHLRIAAEGRSRAETRSCAILTGNATTALELFKRMEKGEFPTAWVDVETRWRYQRGKGEMADLAKSSSARPAATALPL
jgi:hypothetical protein